VIVDFEERLRNALSEKGLLPKSMSLKESAIRKLHIEYPNADSQTNLVKNNILARIGKELASIGDDFADVLEKMNPLAERLAKGAKPHALTESESRSIDAMYDDIENRMALIKPLIKQWDAIKSNPNLYFDVPSVNQSIEIINSYSHVINEYIKPEQWFNKWQGTKPTMHKKTQLVYKEYMELVTEYFARTDAEHERTKHETDLSKIVIKSPEIINLLKPQALIPPQSSNGNEACVPKRIQLKEP